MGQRTAEVGVSSLKSRGTARFARIDRTGGALMAALDDGEAGAMGQAGESGHGKRPNLVFVLVAAAPTLDLAFGRDDGGDAFFQAVLDVLRRLGLW